jgi:hypothetical protein
MQGAVEHVSHCAEESLFALNELSGYQGLPSFLLALLKSCALPQNTGFPMLTA